MAVVQPGFWRFDGELPLRNALKEAPPGGAANLAREIDALFAPFAKPGSPGAVVTVTKHGQEIFSGSYGLANINHAVPLDRKSIIRIGSQTKQFTVLLALMLEAEGKLSMDDEVQVHMPWVPRMAYPVTLRHLASNTSGFRDFLEAMIFSGLPITSQSNRQTGRDVIAAQDDLNYVPGEQMLYSNTGFFLLSEIIEQIEDASFDEVLHARITKPLGMVDTRLMARDGEVQSRLATHYTRQPDGSWRQLPWGIVLGGEGGMVSTLDDMLIWQANLWNPQVGTPAMYDRMAKATAYANGRISPYGLGLVVGEYRGRRVVGHGGTVAGGKSESMRFIDDALGVVIIANNDAAATYSLARRIGDAYFGDTTAAQREGEMAPLARGAGLYREEGGTDLFEIIVQNEEPTFVSAGGPAPFERVGANRFKPERGITDLVLSLSGDGIIDAEWCGAPRHYRRIDRTASIKPQAIAGRYRNAKLGLDVEIGAAEDGRNSFVLRTSIGALRAVLTPLEPELYLMTAAEEAGARPGRPWLASIKVEPQGFVLNSERTRNLRFETER
jgi:CubicO group peptidase (beta-lactamase class C family)